MEELTDRQEQVLHFILSFREDRGRTPTGPEIASRFGYQDPSSAYQHLRLIEKKGYLEIVQPKERGPLQLIPTDAAERATQTDWPAFGTIPAGPVSEVAPDDAASVRAVEDLLPMIRPGDYFLTVSGDSMKGAGLTEGMTLLMRPTETPAEDVTPGDICAVWVEGDGGTLKRVFFENSRVRLVPENEEYDERTYPVERVRVQGMLVAALSILRFRDSG